MKLETRHSKAEAQRPHPLRSPFALHASHFQHFTACVGGGFAPKRLLAGGEPLSFPPAVAATPGNN